MTKNSRLILEVLATGIIAFIGIVVETAMNIAFPKLMQEFQVGTSTVQWLTTGYLLVLALVIPTSAYLSRRFSQRQLFFAGITAAMTGTALCALAPSYSLLLLGRIVQGVGTGIAMPLMFNIILTQAPPAKLGTMMGIATLITAVAPAVGPSLGGLIINYWGWRVIFLVLLPFLVVALLIGGLTIRGQAAGQTAHFDKSGYGLLVVSFVSLIFATSLAATKGWLTPTVLGLLALSISALALFARHASRVEAPLIRVQIFKVPAFTLSIFVVILVQFIVLGLSYLIPNYAQLVNQATPLIAGCLLLPGCILGAFMAPISGRIFDKYGAKRPIGIGALLILGALLSFYIWPKANAIIISIYAIFALGQGLCVGNVMTNGLVQLPKALNSDGNAAFTALQQLAGAIGTSVVTTIVASAQSTGGAFVKATAWGSQQAYGLLALVSGVMVLCTIGIFKTMAGSKQTTAVPVKSTPSEEHS